LLGRRRMFPFNHLLAGRGGAAFGPDGPELIEITPNRRVLAIGVVVFTIGNHPHSRLQRLHEGTLSQEPRPGILHDPAERL